LEKALALPRKSQVYLTVVSAYILVGIVVYLIVDWRKRKIEEELKSKVVVEVIRPVKQENEELEEKVNMALENLDEEQPVTEQSISRKAGFLQVKANRPVD
jgi:hypothetical protein